MDVYVLDEALNVIGVIDNYKSLIWVNRHRAVGDCELYLGADTDIINLLTMGRYLTREGDSMICRIRKIEITTSVDDGDFLTVTGYDVTGLLDQRVVIGNIIADGNAEDFARNIIDDAIGATASAERQMLKPDGTRLLYLDAAAGFTDVTTEQISYCNLGEKIREWCDKYNWGTRTVLRDGAFYFSLYRGTDRSNSVVFSPNYENLASSDYKDDATDLDNTAIIASEGSGANRTRESVGAETGISRYEFYIDGKDLSRNISWGELKKVYPLVASGGEGYYSWDDTHKCYYNMRQIDIYIYDEQHLAQLEEKYPSGTEITIGGKLYYHLENVTIAKFDGEGAPATPEVVAYMYDVIYLSYLLSEAYGRISQHGEITEFNGTVEPNTTFIYKQDYFLGDVVTVENEYGMSKQVRLTEVREVNDENGYTMEPIFENVEGQ